ncbi:F510_1955 family glycosylhydrolase [Lolliginicoccus suaedae]|uniref:F510_1955 family glycosylhydrolase n=1 Tax=Lolliginicoccus suaedae TaxID=2605429 RepID=UPI0011F044F8|nr:sialidase family protein [Lolliginicoccus suaedae]
MKVLRAAVAMAAVAGIAAAGCSSGASGGGSTEALAHIHGIAINPADGEVYAGTHHGVYRVAAEGDLELISENTDDYMGFTVVGADHFLGSGHPAERAPGMDPHLGLIESTDGGRTWDTLSLEGEADFHALEHQNGRVLGLNSVSGQLLSSTDNKTWTVLTELSAYDIAVSPLDNDEILATTPDGLARSRDEGKTFEPVPGAPSLVLLSWPENGPLVAVDAESTVYISSDSGETWQEREALTDRPQALFASADGEILVATEHSIFRSSDGGDFKVFRHLG